MNRRMRISMRWTAVVLLLTGLGLASLGAAADLDALMREFNVSPAGLKPASTFRLKSLEGRTVALAEQRGRTVLLYFWATWRPHCTKELPSTVERLHRDLSRKGLSVIAVNIEESRSTVDAWVREKQVTIPILLDTDGAVIATPTAFLIDRQGSSSGGWWGRAIGPRPLGQR